MAWKFGERFQGSFQQTWNNKTPDNLYQYGALEPDEIRTLLIQPGDSENLLTGQIEQHKLNDPEKPYEALSYAWGSPKRDDIIQVGAQNVQVTRNAKELLLHLRDAHRPRRVWIDGICIDQDNMNERSHQVTLMHSIFCGASSVLIWVGESDQGTEGVFSFFNLMDERHLLAKAEENKDKKEDRAGSSPASDAKFIMNSIKNPSKVRDFVNRAWFHRSWTFQEACLSAETYLLCGQLRLHWRVFVSAALYLASTGLASIFGQSVDTIVALAHFAAANPAHETAYLSVILPLTRQLQVTNAHDKIFSFLGMADRTNMPLLDLSYNLSVSEVYARTAKAMIAQEQGLSVLSGVHGPNRQDQSLPSWVPDWKLSRPAAYLHGYDWPKTTHLYNINEGASFSNDIPNDLGPESHILKLEGAKVDTITHVCDAKELLVEAATLREPKNKITPQSSNNDMSPFKKKLDKLPRKLGYFISSMYDQTQEEIFQALMRTLTADRGGVGEEGKVEWFTKYRMGGGLFNGSTETPVGSWLDWNWDERDTDISQEMSMVTIAMWTFMAGRKVFRTRRGLLGISTEGIKAGDEIWDIIGGKVPYVLRPKKATFWGFQGAERTKGLQVVGEAYVHGIMMGELWNPKTVVDDDDDDDDEYVRRRRRSNWNSKPNPPILGSELKFEDLELV